MNFIETTLASILVAERCRPKLGKHEQIPILVTLEGVSSDIGPCLSSNARGAFVQTKPSDRGTIRYAFSEVPVSSEHTLSRQLYRDLMSQNWVSRATTPIEAIETMIRLGEKPKSIVLPTVQFSDSTQKSWEVEKLASLQDYMSKGVQTLVTDLPPKTGFVVSEPSKLGYYTRVGDHLGVLLKNVDRTIVLVAP